MTTPATRVCVLTSVHDSFDTRIFHKQTAALAAAGYDVTMVAPHQRNERVAGINIIGIPRLRNNLWGRLLRTGLVLWRALPVRADLYHFHDPELVWCGVVLKGLRHRVVYDAHEDLGRDLRDRLASRSAMARVLANLIDVGERFAARRFDAVIVARDDIRPRFAGAPTVCVVSNYPRLDLFRETPSDRAPGDVMKLIYVGVMSRGRGLIEIIRALRLLPSDIDVQLELYGFFSPPEFQQEVEAEANGQKVHYRGRVPYTEVPQVLAAADVGIVCFQPAMNHVNSGPTKLFEYMAAGLPVIGSHFPEWKQIFHEQQCGVPVDPTNSAEIAVAIVEMYRQPESRQAMGRRARHAALSLYNWEIEAARLVGLYGQVLGDRARAGDGQAGARASVR